MQLEEPLELLDKANIDEDRLHSSEERALVLMMVMMGGGIAEATAEEGEAAARPVLVGIS